MPRRAARGRRLGIAAMVLGLVLLVAHDGDDPSPRWGSQPDDLPADQVTAHLVTHLDGTPTALAARPSGDVLVSVQDGRVFDLGAPSSTGWVARRSPEPILDLRPSTASDGLDGLLGITVSPGGRWLIVDRVDRSDGLVVEAYPFGASHGISAAEGHGLLVLQQPEGGGHLGGGLAFGRDGSLYVAVGDETLTSTMTHDEVIPGSLVQHPGSLVGAVVRIGFDEERGARRGAPATVAFGLRNPWRISVDRDRGDLWIGDVGAHRVEEVDRVEAAQLQGPPVNFEWPLREGDLPGRLPGTPEHGVGPLLAREHAKGVCGIVGGYVYRGERLPGWYGAYIYGDLCSSELRALVPRTAGPSLESVVATAPETPISLGEDGSGELYLLGAAGGVYELVVGGSDPPPAPIAYDAGGPTRQTASCRSVRVMVRLGARLAEPTLTWGDVDHALGQAIDDLDRIRGDAGGATVRDLVADIERRLGALRTTQRRRANDPAHRWEPAASVRSTLASPAAQALGRDTTTLTNAAPESCR